MTFDKLTQREPPLSSSLHEDTEGSPMHSISSLNVL